MPTSSDASSNAFLEIHQPTCLPAYMGADLDSAHAVFILPNAPEVPAREVKQGVHRPVDVSAVVAINGNHWRKILTLAAKLMAPEAEQWRSFRDSSAFEALGFCFDPDLMRTEQLPRQQRVFVVGKALQAQLPIHPKATPLDERQDIWCYQQWVWCPYLDYRQFSNARVDALRHRLNATSVSN